MPTFNVGSIDLPSAPIMIGAGACKTPEKTREWLKVAPVVSGSYTPKQNDGNKGDRLFYPDTLEEILELGYGLNSWGMPNIGVEKFAQMTDGCGFEHPLIVSVAGNTHTDYGLMTRLLSGHVNVAAIEWNLGCPNAGHRPMSFSPEKIDLTLSLFKSFTIKKPLWLKLSPYSDPWQLKDVAEVINQYDADVAAVVTCNTLPNAYAGKKAISPNEGLAGMSGPALKPIALGQVYQFRNHLKKTIDVIGIGGIITGNDIVDFLDAGAVGVGMTSLPEWLGDPGKFWPHLTDSQTGNRFLEYLVNVNGD